MLPFELPRASSLTMLLLTASLSVGYGPAALADDHAADTVMEKAEAGAEAVAEAAGDALDAAGDGVTEMLDGDDAADAAERLEDAGLVDDAGGPDGAEANPFGGENPFAPPPAPSEPEPGSDGFENDTERFSYAVGMDVGGSFRTQDIEVVPELMAEALAAAYADEELRLTEEQALSAIQRFQARMMEKQEAEAGAAAEENKAAGATFLEENAARDGVEVLESGLQIEVLAEGDGTTPTADDTVKVHYKGMLVDGEEFDASAEGEPVEFPVSAVIPGFSEGLQRMSPGGKAKLYIPSDLAYGDSPSGPGGPGSTLVFEVEMVEVLPAEPELSLEEQIAEAEREMEEEIANVREYTEQRIADLKEAAGDAADAADEAGDAAGNADPQQYD